MSISLLPSDLRDKESQEKEKVKQAMKEKSFRMHVPNNDLAETKKIQFTPKTTKEDMEIGFENSKPQKGRGVFRLVKKTEKPIAPPPVPPAPKPQSPEIEKPLPVVPVKKEPDTFRMKIPNLIKKFSGKNGKKIIQETSDQLDDVVTPPPISEYFHRDLKKISKEKNEAEVNLMENDYDYLVQKKFWNRLRGLLIIALIFLIIFSGVFIYLKNQKTNLVFDYNQLSQIITQTEAEINTYGFEKMQAIALKDRALVLRILLDEHIYWTKFFGLLEHSTIDDVYYVNFVANSNGDIVLAGKAKTYKDVADQLLVFQTADYVESVEINSATKTPEVVVVEELLTGEIIDEELIDTTQKFPVDFSVTLKLKYEALAKN